MSTPEHPVESAPPPRKRHKPRKARRAAGVHAQAFFTPEEVARIEDVAAKHHLGRIAWAREVCRRAVVDALPYPGDALGETAPRDPRDGWVRLHWTLAPKLVEGLDRARGDKPRTSYLRAVVMQALFASETA